jgi:hypothetical protein
LQERLLIPEHHKLEELVFLNYHRDFFQRVILLEVGVLKIRPLEVFLECELVF